MLPRLAVARPPTPSRAGGASGPAGLPPSPRGGGGRRATAAPRATLAAWTFVPRRSFLPWPLLPRLLPGFALFAGRRRAALAGFALGAGLDHRERNVSSFHVHGSHPHRHHVAHRYDF